MEPTVYLEGLFTAAQTTFNERWEAIKKTESLLHGMGFKDGVNVPADYGLGINEEYPVNNVVIEAVYLATGYDEGGTLCGGVQNGDWYTDKTPNIEAGVEWILTNARLQPVPLTPTQIAQVKSSFESVFAQHLRFTEPMAAIFNFIQDSVGDFYATPEVQVVLEFLWEIRFGDAVSNVKDANDLLELIAKIQAAQAVPTQQISGFAIRKEVTDEQ